MKLRALGIYGGYPVGGHGTACYLLEEGDVRILLDIGSGALMSLERYTSLDFISAVLISHEHSDHTADAVVASYGRLISKQLGRTKENLNFYGPENRALKDQIERHNSAHYLALEEEKTYTFEPFEVTPIKMKHECLTYGYLIKSGDKTLFYSADTTFSEELAKRVKGVDMLLLECSIYDKYGSGEKYGHLNGEEASEFLKIAKPKNAMLIHLPSFGDSTILLEKVKESYKGKVSLIKSDEQYEI